MSDELGYSADEMGTGTFVPVHSRLNLLPVHLIDEVFLHNPVGNIDFIGVNESTEVGLYTVTNNDNWPFISYKLYGDTKFWWLLAQFNSVINPFTELPLVGDTIKVLPKSLMFLILKEVRENLPTKASSGV